MKEPKGMQKCKLTLQLPRKDKKTIVLLYKKFLDIPEDLLNTKYILLELPLPVVPNIQVVPEILLYCTCAFNPIHGTYSLFASIDAAVNLEEKRFEELLDYMVQKVDFEYKYTQDSSTTAEAEDDSILTKDMDIWFNSEAEEEMLNNIDKGIAPIDWDTKSLFNFKEPKKKEKEDGDGTATGPEDS